jgi:RNA polymerase sigma-70 factor (ECF subfamily)
MMSRVHKPVPGKDPGDDSGRVYVDRSIAEARDGSFSALGHLLDHYRDYLLRVANEELQSDLVPKVAPSDLVQETFLQAARDFRRFAGQGEAALRAWLRQILIHNLSDARRSFLGTQRRDLSRETGLHGSGRGFTLAVDIEGCLSGPGKGNAGTDNRLAVQAALARLSEVDRQVITLRTFEGLTFEQVGAAIGRSAEASRKLWSRAIDKLACILNESPSHG